jgi:hypothetical protein
MATISELLIPALQSKFPNEKWTFGASPDSIAFLPALCEEVGDLHITDDGDEAGIFIQHVTHCHINPYEEVDSDEQRAHWIVKEVVGFVDDLLADRILLWAVAKGRRMGGLIWGFDGTIPHDIRKEAYVFVWSRRIRNPLSDG